MGRGGLKSMKAKCAAKKKKKKERVPWRYTQGPSMDPRINSFTLIVRCIVSFQALYQALVKQGQLHNYILFNVNN